MVCGVERKNMQRKHWINSLEFHTKHVFNLNVDRLQRCLNIVFNWLIEFLMNFYRWKLRISAELSDNTSLPKLSFDVHFDNFQCDVIRLLVLGALAERLLICLQSLFDVCMGIVHCDIVRVCVLCVSLCLCVCGHSMVWGQSANNVLDGAELCVCQVVGVFDKSSFVALANLSLCWICTHGGRWFNEWCWLASIKLNLHSIFVLRGIAGCIKWPYRTYNVFESFGRQNHLKKIAQILTNRSQTKHYPYFVY